MVEPTAITAIISLANIGIKLIDSGQKAAKDPDLATGDDLKALSTLLDGVKSMLSINKKLTDDKLDPTTKLATIHTMMIMRAFNDALKEHLSLGQRKSDHKKLNQYISQQLKERKAELSIYDASSLYDGLLQPTASKMYLALWSICSNTEQMDDGLSIEITEDQQLGKGKHQFEMAFYKHYLKYKNGDLGKQLKGFENLPKDHQKRLYRQQLLLNALDLPNQSIFPNGVGPTLNDAYVEPVISLSPKEYNQKGQALEMLTTYRTNKMPSLVTADFGFGKSLTSRMYTAQLAQEALGGNKPTDDYHIPVRIVCQRHMLSEQLNFEVLKRAFKSACMEQISSLIKLSMESDLLPSLTDAKYHLIIDGLDEIVVPSTTCTRFFNELYEQCSGRLRITLFSRPGVIPRDVMNMQRENKLLHLTINSFNEEQTDQWLAKWNRLNREDSPIDVRDFRKALDKKLQCIPIMLFMTATVWDDIQKDNDSDIPRAKLYEHFVCAMAKGKAESKTGTHKAIEDASKVLFRQIEHKLIEENPKTEDAMLWLMGRVAWERYCLKTVNSQDLKISDVQYLLNRELKIDPQYADLVQQGVCVATQTNLANDNNHIFFQHESFAQFFIARFWVHSLKYMFRIERRNKAYYQTLEILTASSFYSGTIAQQEFLLEIGVDDSLDFLEDCRDFIRDEPLTPNITRFREDKIMNVKRVVNQLIILNAVNCDNNDPIYGLVDFSTNENVLSKNSTLEHITFHQANVYNQLIRNSRMYDVFFIDSIIGYTQFNSHSFIECTFEYTILRETWFLNCEFKNTTFRAVTLTDCRFTNCKFTDSSIHRSMIFNATMEHCSFQETKVHDCTGHTNLADNTELPPGLTDIFI